MRATSYLWVLTAVAVGLSAGCTDGGDDDDTSSSSSGPTTSSGSETPTDGFISDNPNSNGDDENGGDAVGPGATSGGDGEGSGSGGGSASPGDGDGDGDGDGEEPPADPERTIAEADIVQVHDGKLYALSRYSGLSIIDIEGDNLALLGRQALGGTPFEMYYEDGVIYAMFSDWGTYVETGDGYWDWVSTSHLEALDVTNPAAIASAGSFELPGYIADSRMVGDVIYTVTFEDGYCWDCDLDRPETTVTSLSVGDPGEIGIVDRLTIEEPNAHAYGWNRSITVNEDRMYIGGVEWWNDVGDQSTIRVVDISDPDGDLRLGTTVEIDGQINSRWQMDEYEGVLRVVSQPWDASVNPSIQTFTVTSANDVTPLGRGELELPQPENLMAARFDGDRGYAITAIQTDPLYTIDLSDPANPRQVGELQLPGFIWHIEPRGDRLLTLGFDGGNEEGGLHVSLYDVADLAEPTELQRINFGGDWGGFSEDQDRIHKLFKIDAERGLVMIPYTGWNWDDGGCGSYQSGVQLVDWQDDDLVKRGVAPIRGEARRAFIEGDRLFALSDEQLRTFDFANRDQPEKTGELQLSTHVSKVAVGPRFAARLAADWWTSEPRIDIVDKNALDSAQPLGSVDLGAMLAEAESDDTCYGWSYWDTRLFVNGDDIYIVWPSWNGSTARLAVIDAANPRAPRLASHIDVPVDVYSYYGWYYWGGGNLVADGQPVVQIGSTLAFLEIDVPTDADGYPSYYEAEPGDVHGAKLRVIDLADVDHPRLASTVDLPAGAGHTKLVAQGDQVLLSHWEPLLDDATRARFFLDRVDVSDPASATLLPKINVPGSLVSFDVEAQNLLTVDYTRERIENVTYDACQERLGYAASWMPNGGYDYNWNELTPGACTLMHRKLRLSAIDATSATASVLDEERLPDNVWFSDLHVGDDRVFTTSDSYAYDEDGGYGESLVWAIGGIRGGDIQIRTKPLDQVWWASPIEAQGKRLMAMTWPGSLLSVDATDLDALEVTKHGDLPWYIENVSFDREGDRALCSLGPYGLAVIDLR